MDTVVLHIESSIFQCTYQKMLIGCILDYLASMCLSERLHVCAEHLLFKYADSSSRRKSVPCVHDISDSELSLELDHETLSLSYGTLYKFGCYYLLQSTQCCYKPYHLPVQHSNTNPCICVSISQSFVER